MSISRKTLCFAYGLIALLALVTTWGNALSYVSLGVVGSNVAFWRDTLVNPASRFLTLDVFFLALAVFVWMVLEARRLGMRGVWLYLLFGTARGDQRHSADLPDQPRTCSRSARAFERRRHTRYARRHRAGVGDCRDHGLRSNYVQYLA